MERAIIATPSVSYRDKRPRHSRVVVRVVVLTGVKRLALALESCLFGTAGVLAWPSRRLTCEVKESNHGLPLRPRGTRTCRALRRLAVWRMNTDRLQAQPCDMAQG